MPLPLIRLATGPVNGTAHFGALLGTETMTACATHSPDLQPVPELTAHTPCQSCSRALLALTTAPHPGEPEARPARNAGRGSAGHLPIPGHLLGYCGKPLDNRPAPTRRRCTLCTRLSNALDALRRRAGELLLPAVEPCHGDDTLLWAPVARGNLVTGHRRNSVTGKAFCDRPLAGPNPGAPNECAPCRIHWEDAELVRQMFTLPHMRDKVRTWHQQDLDVFDDRARTLTSGDAYTLSGCQETHYVVAVADRGGENHTGLLVYLPAEERVSELRLRRDRLVAVQRPPR
ncbi:hypothetical protein [Streptomyces sp. NPDC014894]|uniref:hypothetical protein n=1 Tax=Streptomyces sp. NPDC014894 TaxID=3364931 RepID=UPI0036FA6014